ncbi:MAG TPA: hypothetical protein VIM19_20045 [Actinomycetes bacterium]
MRDLQRSYEAFQFACPACDTRWCRVYEVTTHANPDGLASKDYRRADLLVSAPLDDRDCPSCGTAATVVGPTLAALGRPRG